MGNSEEGNAGFSGVTRLTIAFVAGGNETGIRKKLARNGAVVGLGQ